MAESFTINSSFTLKQIYTGHTDLINKKGREKVSANTLSAADSRALRKSLLMLAGTEKDDDADDADKKKFLEKIRAFNDAYNYTLESGSGSQNESIAKAAGSMKKLTKAHAAELESCGISVDSNGYMSVNENRVKELSSAKFDKYLGGNSDYNKALTKLTRRISSHVDVAL